MFPQQKVLPDSDLRGTDLTFFFGSLTFEPLKIDVLLKGFQSALQILDHNGAYLRSLWQPVWERKILKALRCLETPSEFSSFQGLEYFLERLISEEKSIYEIRVNETLSTYFSKEKKLYFETGLLLCHMMHYRLSFPPSYSQLQIKKWVQHQADFLGWWQVIEQVLFQQSPVYTHPFQQVKSLVVNNINLKTLKIAWLTNLKIENLFDLDLSNNLIETIDLKELVHLRRLSLSKNRLRELNLNGAAALDGLDLSENYLERVTITGSIPSRKFDLLKDDLPAEGGMKILTTLQIINLSKNWLKRIQFPEMINLWKLDLSENRLRLVEGLYRLKNLKSLDLSNNKLQTIDLSELVNLEKLDLSTQGFIRRRHEFDPFYSRLQNLKGLSELTKLVTLKLPKYLIIHPEDFLTVANVENLYLSESWQLKINGVNYLGYLRSGDPSICLEEKFNFPPEKRKCTLI